MGPLYKAADGKEYYVMMVAPVQYAAIKAMALHGHRNRRRIKREVNKAMKKAGGPNGLRI